PIEGNLERVTMECRVACGLDTVSDWINTMIVAIDGPVGVGKSTVAREVAKRLGLLHIDTGAMYRALAWKCLEEDLDCAEPAVMTELAGRTRIDLEPSPEGP